jgi:hypothetical protein
MKPLRFQFQTAVAQLCDLYPKAARDVTFINLDTSGAEKLMQAWWKATSPQYRKFCRTQQYYSMKFLLENELQDMARARKDPLTGKGLILFSPRKIYENATLHPDRAKKAFTTFWHETGHILLKNGLPPWTQNMEAGVPVGVRNAQVLDTETGCDIFAAVNGLRLGFLDRQDISRISFQRAYNAWINKDVGHATTIALDGLLLAPETARVPGSGDVLRIAERLRQSYETRPEEISRAHRFFARASDETSLTALGRQWERQPPGSLPFHLCARILAHFPDARLERGTRNLLSAYAQKTGLVKILGTQL